ncbi:hypothetical protein CANINC_004841 [Pichia inconspicua]|uniref:SAGA-associated factor 11 n=1 Tax=Pichia inconspicua TaxID=52247 RepID=A0A4T0WV14_9ASCO|nr:hypothetical protein CANINC_004841 [[Candida] inconspicua]
MTSSDDQILFSTFCGTLLDQMLEQIVQNMITRLMFDEKVMRNNYGTIDAPKFHEVQPTKNKTNNNERTGDKSNKPINLENSDSDESDAETNNQTNNVQTSSEPDIGRFSLHINGKDVYANALTDNKKFLGDRASSIVIGTAQDMYFSCSNCGRKIAGSRFGAHIDKCLGGRSRK